MDAGTFSWHTRKSISAALADSIRHKNSAGAQQAGEPHGADAAAADAGADAGAPTGAPTGAEVGSLGAVDVRMGEAENAAVSAAVSQDDDADAQSDSFMKKFAELQAYGAKYGTCEVIYKNNKVCLPSDSIIEWVNLRRVFACSLLSFSFLRGRPVSAVCECSMDRPKC